MNRKKLSGLSPELAELAVRVNQLHQEAEKAGLFLSHRPLLHCPECGLWEDVTFEGRLVTYFASDKAVSDTGLRFESVPQGFRCPYCHASLDAPAEDEGA